MELFLNIYYYYYSPILNPVIWHINNMENCERVTHTKR